jgi:hypothetical protein
MQALETLPQLSTLKIDHPAVTAVALLILLMGFAHSARIFIEVLALLVRHFKGELVDCGHAWGHLSRQLTTWRDETGESTTKARRDRSRSRRGSSQSVFVSRCARLRSRHHARHGGASLGQFTRRK